MSSYSARPLLRAGLLALLLGTNFALSACHTVEGLGEDVSAVGNKISTKAEEHTK